MTVYTGKAATLYALLVAALLLKATVVPAQRLPGGGDGRVSSSVRTANVLQEATPNRREKCGGGELRPCYLPPQILKDYEFGARADKSYVRGPLTASPAYWCGGKPGELVFGVGDPFKKFEVLEGDKTKTPWLYALQLYVGEVRATFDTGETLKASSGQYRLFSAPKRANKVVQFEMDFELYSGKWTTFKWSNLSINVLCHEEESKLIEETTSGAADKERPR